VQLVEELVSRPLQRTHQRSGPTLIQLHCPGTTRLVFGCRFEETLVEGRGREVELGALSGALNVAEVEIVVQAHAGLAIQPTEGFVAPHLVFGCHFEGADRADLAVIFDCVDNSRQTVKFCKQSA